MRIYHENVKPAEPPGSNSLVAVGNVVSVRFGNLDERTWIRELLNWLRKVVEREKAWYHPWEHNEYQTSPREDDATIEVQLAWHEGYLSTVGETSRQDHWTGDDKR